MSKFYLPWAPMLYGDLRWSGQKLNEESVKGERIETIDGVAVGLVAKMTYITNGIQMHDPEYQWEYYPGGGSSGVCKDKATAKENVERRLDRDGYTMVAEKLRAMK